MNGRALPWVEHVTHLGHELNQACNMDFDVRCKRAAFIEKSTDIRETFKFARPAEILSAIHMYVNTIYGFALWDLYGERAESAFRCYTTTTKLAWDVPRTTHR